MSIAPKTLLLKAFNKQFFDFLEDIITVIPENKDLLISRMYFQTIKSANPTTLIKVWYEYVYKPYADVIKDGDIYFFLHKDYSSDIQINKEYITKVIDESLRQPLLGMDETNKKHCIDYANVLNDLSKRYHLS